MRYVIVSKDKPLHEVEVELARHGAINIRKAKEAGVKMAINTDSHARDQMRYMELGVFQARRGWAEPRDIINSWPVEKLIGYFEKT